MWNDQSSKRWQGVDQRLLDVMKRAREISGVPFEISEGMRGESRQKQLVAQGKSQTMNSRHLHGNAVDVHIPDGKGGVNWDFESYRPIADAAKQAALELGYDDFSWGGDWDSLKDGVHFQIGGAGKQAGSQTIANDTMRVLGKQPKGLLTPETADATESKKMIPEEKPRGLLGSLGIQKMVEGAEGETGQRFTKRDTFKDTAARLAQGFAAMGSNPALQKMTADVAAQRTEGKAKNKTIEYLRANSRDDLADAVESGSLGIRDAAGIMFSKPKDDRTALMQNYEYALSKGMSAEEARTWVSSGNTTNIRLPGEKGSSEFEELDAQALADVSSTAMAAGRSLGQIDRLESLLSGVDTGMAASMQSLAGSFGIKTEGLGDIQAAEALISALVPQQRTPGSGPMSDADLDLFKKSLPRLINTPGGNAMILQTMRGLAQYDALGGEIVQRYRSKEITQAEAFAQLQARQDPFAQFRSVVGGEQGSGMDRNSATELLLNSGGRQ
tara:strand:- start:1560 stop:3056 length:1497 start_codon:yes stop_codon:yes gene_type:complete